MPAKSLMVLGTSSGCGKSVIAAGLCRVFSDWGYRVAPFKAQNMSNNSFVTEAGGEIGRAQAVQAECARVRPHVDMNPVLLKPAEDNRSQVVVQGRAIGHFSARDYFSERPKIAQAIRESYQRLAAIYEVLILEGAGSPAEINLKENDLVNMKMAELADASCVLVGDIDRGGVFASLIGTLELLEARERERIVGFIINKFRGDRSLLESGLDFLEERTGKKVLGVIPYDRDLWMESEDALALERVSPQEGDLDIAILLLPRISNFTDFEILAKTRGVLLRYVKNPKEMGCPDLLILPGTKATLSDLEDLERRGFREKILDYGQKGGRILGICGGFQMMGEILLDPEGVESSTPAVQGFGFFNMTTEFHAEKVLRRVEQPIKIKVFGNTIEGNVEGYEIHMGRTVFKTSYETFGEGGAVHPNGRFAGTYLHGLFDPASFRQSFLTALRESVGKKRKEEGLPPSAKELKEINYHRLKNLLTQHLNLEFFRECLKLPSPSCLTF